jgi:hypothetical protein
LNEGDSDDVSTNVRRTEGQEISSRPIEALAIFHPTLALAHFGSDEP